jgi:hypothetical protein
MENAGFLRSMRPVVSQLPELADFNKILNEYDATAGQPQVRTY